MSWLEVENVSLAFGGLKAVDNLSFSVERGKVLTHRRLLYTSSACDEKRSEYN